MNLLWVFEVNHTSTFACWYSLFNSSWNHFFLLLIKSDRLLKNAINQQNKVFFFRGIRIFNFSTSFVDLLVKWNRLSFSRNHQSAPAFRTDRRLTYYHMFDCISWINFNCCLLGLIKSYQDVGAGSVSRSFTFLCGVSRHLLELTMNVNAIIQGLFDGWNWIMCTWLINVVSMIKDRYFRMR